jgi:NAD(P)-dependent dehydrogenase (short-subunit alcohol dehydrogenase family)
MTGRVSDKVIIVTGGASNPGLGNATAKMLAREGAKVVVTDIDEQGAASCAHDINADGGSALAMCQDVTDENRWQEVIDETVDIYGRVDGLVNNAGIAILKPFAELTIDDFNRQVTVNLTSVFLGCRHAMTQMRLQGGGGVLINLSSVAAIKGMARCGAYAAAKGGVRAMSRAIAMDGAPDNIRCNTIFPGVIWTNMQAQAIGSDSIDSRISPSRVPLGRAGDPDDVAASVLYLASDEAQYITGAELTVDAGMTAN